MATAVGKMAGELKRTERSTGAMAPTRAAHHGPHRKPASSTGMCMGHRVLPIWGIWPVRKGSSRHRDRLTAA